MLSLIIRTNSLVNFALREYAAGTGLWVEGFIVLMALQLIGSDGIPLESIANALFFSLLVALISTNRIVTRWNGTTRDLFVIALGRPAFDIGLAIVGAIPAMLVGVAVLIFGGGANSTILVHAIFPIAAQSIVVSLIVILIGRPSGQSFDSRSPVVMSSVIVFAGFGIDTLNDKWKYLGFLFPTGVSVPVVVKLLAVCIICTLINHIPPHRIIKD